MPWGAHSHELLVLRHRLVQTSYQTQGGGVRLVLSICQPRAGRSKTIRHSGGLLRFALIESRKSPPDITNRELESWKPVA